MTAKVMYECIINNNSVVQKLSNTRNWLPKPRVRNQYKGVTGSENKPSSLSRFLNLSLTVAWLPSLGLILPQDSSQNFSILILATNF